MCPNAAGGHGAADDGSEPRPHAHVLPENGLLRSPYGFFALPIERVAGLPTLSDPFNRSSFGMCRSARTSWMSADISCMKGGDSESAGPDAGELAPMAFWGQDARLVADPLY